MFTYSAPVQQVSIVIHDHRDNFNGGFAFERVSPGGTYLPQSLSISAGYFPARTYPDHNS